MGALRAAGLDATVIDLNLEFFEAALSEATLRRCLAVAEKKRRALDARGSLGGRELIEYVPLLQHAGLIDLPGRIEADVATFRGERFYDFESYIQAATSVNQALGLLSATTAPLSIRMDRVASTLHDFDSSAELQEAIDAFLSQEDNIARELIEARLDAGFGQARPRLVGVSITYPAQLFFGMLTARLVRRRFPDTFLILGGPLVASMARRAHRLGQYPLFRDADAVAIGDGEHLFRQVVAQVTSGRPVTPAANLLLFDRATGTATLPDVQAIADLDALPCADFGDFALDRYWVPTPVLPMPIARGCYWDKCTFCYYGFVPDGRRATAPYRERSVEKIVDDLRTLGQRHGCQHFDFTVDLVSPRLLDRLAAAIHESGLPARWGLEIRAERSFNAERCRRLRAGGLTYAEFGLESMDQSVLDGICKGTQVQQYADVLRDFHQAGVATGAMGFFDFPGEDHAAAQKSVAFLREHGDHISEIAWGNFALDIGSQVHRAPARFGIEALADHPEEDLALSANFVPSVRLKSDEERAAAERGLRELLDEGGYPTGFSRPFVGGGTGEAHTFLLYSRLGPDAAKAFGRYARARAARGLRDDDQLRQAVDPLATRYPADELGARFDQISGLLAPRKGEPLLRLEKRSTRREIVARWDREKSLEPGQDEQLLLAVPGWVATIPEDVSRLLALFRGGQAVGEVLGRFPAQQDEIRGLLAQALAMGWLVRPREGSARRAQRPARGDLSS